MRAVLRLGPLVATGPLATVRRGSLGGRAVAVKQARADVPGAAAALRREVRVLGAASHPALVPVLDVVDDPDQPAVVLGWADGGSLEDLLADGALGTDDVLHLLRPVGGALDALHRAGVAHLDVSTRNVLLAAAGPVLIDPAPPGAGTPGFADPAVAAGGLASSRSDVFGLAACAHAALTGLSPPVQGGVAPGVGLPAAVLAILAGGLDPAPASRPPTAAAFLDQLEAALRPGAPPAATLLPRHPGRPVVRGARPSAEPPRTWPFDRWQAESDAAEARSQGAATVGRGPGRRWRRLVQVRSSVPDDTRRHHAARPPPATIPGGKP